METKNNTQKLIGFKDIFVKLTDILFYIFVAYILVGSASIIAFPNVTWIGSVLFLAVLDEMILSGYILTFLIISLTTLIILKLLQAIESFQDIKKYLKIFVFAMLFVSVSIVSKAFLTDEIKGVKIEALSDYTTSKLKSIGNDKGFVEINVSSNVYLKYNKKSNILYLITRFTRKTNLNKIQLSEIEDSIKNFKIEKQETPSYLY